MCHGHLFYAIVIFGIRYTFNSETPNSLKLRAPSCHSIEIVDRLYDRKKGGARKSKLQTKFTIKQRP